MTSDQGRLTLQFVGGEVEGIDAVIGQLAEEDHARHARQPRGRTGRQPPQFVELDGCGEADRGGGVLQFLTGHVLITGYIESPLEWFATDAPEYPRARPWRRSPAGHAVFQHESIVNHITFVRKPPDSMSTTRSQPERPGFAP